MSDKKICGCNNVTEGQIVEVIKGGAITVEKVGEITKAGTGCGGCKPAIQTIIDANA